MKSFSFALYRFTWKWLLVVPFPSFKMVEILIGHCVSIEKQEIIDTMITRIPTEEETVFACSL